VLSTSDGALLTAPIVQAGAFVELTTLLNLSSGFALPTTFDIAPAHSTNGTHSGVPGSVVIFPGDGSGTPVTLPGGVLPAFTAAQLGRQSAYGWQGPDGGAGQVAEPFTWG